MAHPSISNQSAKQEPPGTPLFVSDNGSGFLRRIDEREYLEEKLQKIVDEHPEVLPAWDFLPGVHLYSLGREIEVDLGGSMGYIDNLLVSDSGHIIIVETKLRRNPEALREVIAQTLQYAMALMRISSLEFETRLRRAKEARLKVDESVFEYLQNHASAAFPAIDDEFESTLDERRTRGEILLLIVADRIRASAERLVEWINTVAGSVPFKLGLVELAIYQSPNGGEIVIPKAVLRIREGVRHVVSVSFKDQARGLVHVSVNESGLPTKTVTAPKKDQDLTEESFKQKVRAKHPTEVAELIEQIRGSLESSGLAARYSPSEIIYGVEIDGEMLGLAHLAVSSLYILIPARAARAMGDEKFVQSKKALNSVAAFYRSEAPDDMRIAMQKYEILSGRVEAFSAAVGEVADIMRDAIRSL